MQCQACLEPLIPSTPISCAGNHHSCPAWLLYQAAACLSLQKAFIFCAVVISSSCCQQGPAVSLLEARTMPLTCPPPALQPLRSWQTTDVFNQLLFTWLHCDRPSLTPTIVSGLQLLGTVEVPSY